MRRSLVLVWAVAFLVLGCKSGTTQESFETRNPYPPAPPGFARIKIVLLPFENSANVSQFDIIPDGDYTDEILNRPGADPESTPTAESIAPVPPVNPPPVSPAPQSLSDEALKLPKAGPEVVLPGDLYREIAETELFQSGRFDVIPYFQYLDERKKIDPELKDPASALTAARNLGVQLLVSGDCTDFEINQATQSWKVPLWALALAGSFAINDQRAREAVWEILVRLFMVVPLDSDFWRAGVGWEDQQVNVNVSLNLRTSGTGGSVTFSEESTVKRTETIRNLDLLVWKDTNRVRIKKASAGRQIRFATIDLVLKLAKQTDKSVH